MKDYVRILQEELVPAMGCTEPIAIALCAAKARAILGQDPERMEVYCSGNIIKNARSVTVPGTKGMCGIEAAAAAGCFGGDAELLLEVLSSMTDEALKQARQFVADCRVKILHAKNVDSLYIKSRLFAGSQVAEAVIEHEHTHFVELALNGEHLLQVAREAADADEEIDENLDVAEIIRFAEGLDCDTQPVICDLIDRQSKLNLAIAQEGLDNSYGAMVGRTILDCAPDALRERIRAYAAAGSDARMAGCAMPVVINSGSGNQGITTSLPLIIYAQEKGMDQETLRRGLVLSNLLAFVIKRLIGRLSAFCGVVSAAAAAGAGLAWLEGLNEQQITQVLSITLLTAGGIFCDGAKASCASKIAVSLDSALLALDMVKKGRSLPALQGLDAGDINATIRDVARIAREGMQETDNMILETMLATCPHSGN